MTTMQTFEREVKQGLYHFEPLLLLYLDHEWVHPLIDHDKYGPAETHMGLPIGTFHRIWIHFGDKTTATLVVTSRMLDDYWRTTAQLENIKGTARREKRKPNKLQHIKSMVEICLTEDTWSPGCEQFCFSEFGKLLAKAFRGKWSLEIGRSEIGAITLEEDGYSFEAVAASETSADV